MVAVIVMVSLTEGEGQVGSDDPKGIPLAKSTFKTEPLYTIGSFAVLTILAFLYAFFWG